MSKWSILEADVLAALKTMPDCSFDGVLCDPPYELGFMGRGWDKTGIAFQSSTWSEVFRVLKPGAHLLAFGGTRTYHRLACAIEDAGFDIRDCIMWCYGCLDNETKAVTREGIKGHEDLAPGEEVLCYCVETGRYSFQPLLEVLRYEYCDTAYRLVGDFVEQVVSRNHRCIVERGGKEVFTFAEEAARELQARVPILENLQGLLEALHGNDERAGRQKKNLFSRVRQGLHHRDSINSTIGTQGKGRSHLLRMREGGFQKQEARRKGEEPCVLETVQRSPAWRGMEGPCSQGKFSLDGGVEGEAKGPHDGQHKPILEGREDIPQPEGGLRFATDQIRQMPGAPSEHGTEGRIRDGASPCGGTSHWTHSLEVGSGSPRQPRCDGQQAGELDAVQDERAAQSLRERGGHRTALVQIEPFQYNGIVWCLRVPTGAFVAVRGGVAFPTGNSGFPKSLDVSKAMDKAEGKTRAMLGPKVYAGGHVQNHGGGEARISRMDGEGVYCETAPSSDLARTWNGYGTALKPAYEPCLLARKPLDGTVAQNCMEHGVGGLWIDGGRVAHNEDCKMMKPSQANIENPSDKCRQGERRTYVLELKPSGRFPANLILDSSEEVEACFPETSSGQPGFRRKKHQTAAMMGTLKPLGIRESEFGDSGSSSRFFQHCDFDPLEREEARGIFYTAKASTKERNAGCDGIGEKDSLAQERQFTSDPRMSKEQNRRPQRNNHPCVKPLSLTEYLSRLILPPSDRPNGPRRILVPFSGSGSEMIGALMAGWDEAVGIEQAAEYVEIAKARLEHWISRGETMKKTTQSNKTEKSVKLSLLG